MPRRIVVWGSGGHAKVVIDVLALRYLPSEIAVLDDGPEAIGRMILGLPVRGGRDWVTQALGWEQAEVALGIGSNVMRAEFLDWLASHGRIPATVIHPRATVSASASIASGCFLAAGAIVNAEAFISEGVIINSGASVDHDCRIDTAAHIAPGARLCGNVRVGPRALVGTGSAVIPGVSIGADAVVGAGSVVIADVPDGARVAGSPARPLRAPVLPASPSGD